MNNFTRYGICVFAWLSATAGFAQPPLRLLCKGNLETTKDAVVDTQPAVLDVAIDLADQSVEIDGFWGCFADIGQAGQAKQDNRCLNKLPVRVTDAELTYAGKSDGDLYSGQSVFTINRYSATISVASNAVAKPAAKATWSLMIISGKLQCASVEKKF